MARCKTSDYHLVQIYKTKNVKIEISFIFLPDSCSGFFCVNHFVFITDLNYSATIVCENKYLHLFLLQHTQFCFWNKCILFLRQRTQIVTIFEQVSAINFTFKDICTCFINQLWQMSIIYATTMQIKTNFVFNSNAWIFIRWV